MGYSNISGYSLFIMTRLFRALASGLSFLACNTEGSVTIFVPQHTPLDASDPIPKDFQSLSIELAHWPDFAGLGLKGNRQREKDLNSPIRLEGGLA